jgi:hypothetical protein
MQDHPNDIPPARLNLDIIEQIVQRDHPDAANDNRAQRQVN